MSRRMVILAEGKFSPLESKTANQAIRYLSGQVVGVIDSRQSGRTAQQVLGFGGDIPVFADLRTALAKKPTALLIGIAPTGGQLPIAWRAVIREAIEYELTIISGLHTLLRDDTEFVRLAQQYGVDLVDLRSVPKEYEIIAKGLWKTRTVKTILTVGTDCNVGKMTASLELYREFSQRGLRSDFVATGQTGILLSGKGVAVDHLLSDFVAGAIELEIEKSIAAGHEYIFVEGQGALTHQGYSAVTLGLLHGVMPDAMVLVHHPTRRTDDYGFPLHDIPMFVRLHETIVGIFKSTKVVGIAVNSAMMTSQQTAAAIQEIEQQTGLPTANVLSPDVIKLADALEKYLAVKQTVEA
jgi:uncharacterized NAD-dependent epimerase/dehydratase family protein